MEKFKVELTKDERANVIAYLTIQYENLEKRMLQIQKDIIQENDPEWKQTMTYLQNDYIKEINELVYLINIFRFAK